jgi:HPt (histidine-containing phosphotransfer) domain-containing protein
MYKMVDLLFLEKFTKGNPTKMRRYISMYLNMAPETFERMHQNIRDKSWPELAINAHSLKPQAEFMGISALKELLIEIEKKVKSDQTEGLEALFTKAKSIHDESEVFLQDYINNG